MECVEPTCCSHMHTHMHTWDEKESREESYWPTVAEGNQQEEIKVRIHSVFRGNGERREKQEGVKKKVDVRRDSLDEKSQHCSSIQPVWCSMRGAAVEYSRTQPSSGFCRCQ